MSQAWLAHYNQEVAQMRPNSRRGALITGVLLVIASLAVLFIGRSSFGSTDPYTPPPSVAVTPPSATTPAATTTKPTATVRTCRTGTPVRFYWDEAGINNVPVDTVGTASDGSPGVPGNKHNIGWYSESARPGAGKGTSFVTGHTYADDTAVFKEEFTDKLTVGERYAMKMDNGSLCWYEVTKVHPYLDKQTEYPVVAEANDFLRPDGPERSVGCTCSGYFDTRARSHNDSTCWEAKPIN